MEQKELMINDWVKFAVSKYPHKKGELFRIETHECFTLSHKLCPIQLTEEILQNNGFIVRNDGELYLSVGFLGNDWCRSGIWVRFYKRIAIEIECNHNGYTNRVHLIANYVHELQHALRLCGLNELSDNFKI